MVYFQKNGAHDEFNKLYYIGMDILYLDESEAGQPLSEIIKEMDGMARYSEQFKYEQFHAGRLQILNNLISRLKAINSKEDNNG